MELLKNGFDGFRSLNPRINNRNWLCPNVWKHDANMLTHSYIKPSNKTQVNNT